MKETEKQFLEAVEEAKQRLVAGEKPEDVFDDYDDFYEGFARVQLNNKYNFINSDCKLLSNTWFDFCWNFQKGLAWVKLGGKWNYIDCNGNFLSTIWFDDCRCFRNGFALVKLNGVDYLLRKDGVLCNYGTKEPIELGYSVSNIDYKKKYEEALERAKDIYNDDPNSGTARAVCEQIFPELKESEDENIRKEILYVIHQLDNNTTICGRNYDFKKWISWLEKQGELVNSLSKGLDNAHERIDGLIQKNNSLIEQLEKQGEQIDYNEELKKCKENPLYFYDKYVKIKIKEQNPTDKTEPKFKVGNWITNNCNVWCIENIHDGLYDLKGQHSCVMKNLKSKTIDDKFHLWTIQDAKEGDVLCYEDEVFILKNYVLFHKIVYHCCYDGKNLVSHSIYSLTKDDFNKIHPATEEQRDLLFSKMKEAGYEWDYGKKELKKFEQEDDSELTLTDFESVLFSAFSDAWQEYLNGKTVNITKWAREHSAELLEVARNRKSAWSEEDEKHLFGCINYFSGITESSPYYNDYLWLESIKKRMKEE